MQVFVEYTKPRLANLTGTDDEEADLDLCPVCYDQYPKDKFFALKCGHRFCEICVKEHLRYSITEGRAVKITCMELGCPEEFKLAEIERFCPK